MSDNSLLAVEQRHRDAAASAFPAVAELTCEGVRWGLFDNSQPVQAFARFERDHMPTPDTVRAQALEDAAREAEKLGHPDLRTDDIDRDDAYEDAAAQIAAAIRALNPIVKQEGE